MVREGVCDVKRKSFGLFPNWEFENWGTSRQSPYFLISWGTSRLSPYFVTVFPESSCLINVFHLSNCAGKNGPTQVLICMSEIIDTRETALTVDELSTILNMSRPERIFLRYKATAKDDEPITLECACPPSRKKREKRRARAKGWATSPNKMLIENQSRSTGKERGLKSREGRMTGRGNGIRG